MNADNAPWQALRRISKHVDELAPIVRAPTATNLGDFMATDKRSVTTDALETLGTIIDESAGRDAIHLAVEPVVAAHAMEAGAHVGLMPDGRASELVEKKLGIVDPFLDNGVEAGERFWLVVYPRQITSLRHVWTHPAFAEPTNSVSADSSKAASEQWLRDFISRSDCPDYETVIAAAINNSDTWSSEYLHFNGSDAHGEIPPEFWMHVEIVTGHQIPKDDRAEYFSCSC